MVPVETVFIAGHARLPQGMAAKSVFDTLTITAEVEMTYGVIVEASCTLATEHGRDFIGRLLKGVSLKDGIEKPVEKIQKYYRGKATNALIAALKDLHLQYEEIRYK
ncbi:DUF3870 domain-containing protein [Aliibacillus thermotolerans]|uniref:DUF3870 domain-containing protein n=1 Tax=Aliibacillus thermotolerans TaxID=1834418 RepID=A0ABW0U435_9BACI|nr:DUF3870 domain-containing protein [Aliibacillus thermotolerans]MDA3128822.1 DUF3870 domain-containing protein [Aliibacillus thermotolerans]